MKTSDSVVAWRVLGAGVASILLSAGLDWWMMTSLSQRKSYGSVDWAFQAFMYFSRLCSILGGALIAAAVTVLLLNRRAAREAEDAAEPTVAKWSDDPADLV